MTSIRQWLPEWATYDFNISARAVLAIVLLLIAAWILTALSRRAIRLFRIFALRSAKGAEDHRRVDTLSRVFRYLANVAISGLTFMLILSELGISIAPILGAAGVVGIAVGFGAQSLVKDFFTGFVVLLENQIRQGDVITVAGRTGRVESVTLRNVRLRDYDGQVHFVPNGMIDVVTNLSMEFSFAVIDVGVGYRQNLDEVFAALRAVAQSLRTDPVHGARILDDIEIAGVERLADSSVIMRCRLKCVPLEQWNIKREFLRRMMAEFDARGIEIPFPQLTLHAAAAPEGGSAAAMNRAS